MGGTWVQGQPGLHSKNLSPLQEKRTLITQQWNSNKPHKNWAEARHPVTHTCNSSYSGDRDQEDCGSKPARANSLRDPISKKSITKKGCWSGSRCRPWVRILEPKKKNPKKGCWSGSTCRLRVQTPVPHTHTHTHVHTHTHTQNKTKKPWTEGLGM
jgi:hypothetical protein